MSYKRLNIIVVLLCFGEGQCKLAWLTESGGVVYHMSVLGKACTV